jgi:hypothetical protein
MSAVRRLWMAIPLTGAALMPVEAVAQECWLYCDWDAWLSLTPRNAAAIPIDGVLVLQAELHDKWVEPAGSIALEVTKNGEPVAGALESTPIHGVMVWRPAQWLEPGATYQVHGTVHNPPLDDCPDFPDIPLDFEFHADLGPAEPLPAVLPPQQAAETIEAEDFYHLGSMVCCDGAYPQTQWADCFEELGPGWSQGFCTPVSGTNWLKVQVSQEVPVGPATAGLLARQLLWDGGLLDGELDGPLEHWHWDPFCAVVRVRNLATGETRFSDERCYGVDTPVGAYSIDVATATAAACVGVPYTCALGGEEDLWDPAECWTWPDGAPIPAEDESTAGESTTGAPPDDGTTSGEGLTTGASWGPAETGTGGPKPEPGPKPAPEPEPAPEPTTGASPLPDGGGAETGSSSAGHESSASASLDSGCACNERGGGPWRMAWALPLLLRPRRRSDHGDRLR